MKPNGHREMSKTATTSKTSKIRKGPVGAVVSGIKKMVKKMATQIMACITAQITIGIVVSVGTSGMMGISTMNLYADPVSAVSYKPLYFEKNSNQGKKVTVVAFNNLIAKEGESIVAASLEVAEEKTEYTGPIQLIGKAYNYPNPFSISSGQTTIGFRTNKLGETLDLDVYSLRGNKIYSQTIQSNDGYVKEVLTKEKMGLSYLEPGVYLFTISHNGKLLAKNRMVVVP